MQGRVLPDLQTLSLRACVATSDPDLLKIRLGSVNFRSSHTAAHSASSVLLLH